MDFVSYRIEELRAGRCGANYEKGLEYLRIVEAEASIHPTLLHEADGLVYDPIGREVIPEAPNDTLDVILGLGEQEVHRPPSYLQDAMYHNSIFFAIFVERG